MQVYTVNAIDNAPLVRAAIERVFTANYLPVGDGFWLVAGSGTAQEICAQLGMPTVIGAPGPGFFAVVTVVGGYFGFAQNNVWEWIAAKQAQPATSKDANPIRVDGV